MEFSRLPNPGIEPRSPTLQADSLPAEPQRKPKNTVVGSLSLLQRIFPTQDLNQGLPHCRQIHYQLNHQGSPRILEWVAYHFSSGSSRPRNRNGVSCIAGGFFTNWAIREASLPDHLTCLLRNLQVRKQQLELDMEQQTGSKSGKEYVKVVYCHPAYLTSLQSTLCEMPGWMKHTPESRFLGEISITDSQMTPPLWQKVKRN